MSILSVSLLLWTSFDDHIVFTSKPVLDPATRQSLVYYMGGNGPHSGYRNTSFAVASLDGDKYVGLKVPATGFISEPILILGSSLFVTVDIAEGDSVWLGIANVTGLSWKDLVAPVTQSGVRQELHFKHGQTLAPLVGQSHRLVLRSRSAEGDTVLYTVGFDGAPAE